MNRSVPGILIPAVLLLVLLPELRSAAQQPAPVKIPVRAQLLKQLDAQNLRADDIFYLKTTGEWKTDGCVLGTGSEIRGQIASNIPRKDGKPRSELKVRFDAVACPGLSGVSVTPLLVAMRSGHPPMLESAQLHENMRAEEDLLRSMMSGVGSSSGTTGVGTIQQMGEPDPEREKPLKTGEVRGIRDVSMELPKTEPLTTLFSSHNIQLKQGTEFVLMFIPTPEAATHTETAGHPSGGVNRPAASAGTDEWATKGDEPAEIADVCAGGECKSFAEAGSAESKAEWKLGLAGLGFHIRPQKFIRDGVAGLDDDASVFFLGEDELLFTYNPHRLVRRTAAEAGEALTSREVCGFIVSRSDGRVLRAVNWLVQGGSSRYVWGLSGGRVLAHVGKELVIYGPDLVELGRFKLRGPLEFVSVAGGGDLLLVATVHERHTREEHEQLASFLGPNVPVDEEYDLTTLNKALEVTASRTLSVTPSAPSLFGSAMMTTRQVHPEKWSVEESAWNGKKKILAHFDSACDLRIQSLAAELLFVSGCAPRQQPQTWYRMLNNSGQTLLKGVAAPAELVQQVLTDADVGLIAIASTQFDASSTPGLETREGEFKRLKVTVYNTSTGKQVFAAQPAGGSAMLQTAALSPSGAFLVVLTSDALQVYAVGGAPTAGGH